MVHIPVFNIDVPEVKLATLLPELVINSIRICSKAMDAAMFATHPLPVEIEEAYVQTVLDSFPREIKKVYSRGADGKHKNEDQLSSELEDAAFDYYRRMIRTSVAGETDEDQEDVTAYKLGLDRPSSREAVWAAYHAAWDEDLEADDPAVVLGVENTPEEKEAIESALTAAKARLHEAEIQAILREEQQLQVSRSVLTGPRQSFSSAANAGLGMALGAAAVKGVGLLLMQIRRLRKSKAKRGAKKVAVAKTAAAKPAAGAARAAAAAAAAAAAQAQQQAASSGAVAPKASSTAPKPDAAAAQAKARPRATAARKR